MNKNHASTYVLIFCLLFCGCGCKTTYQKGQRRYEEHKKQLNAKVATIDTNVLRYSLADRYAEEYLGRKRNRDNSIKNLDQPVFFYFYDKVGYKKPPFFYGWTGEKIGLTKDSTIQDYIKIWVDYWHEMKNRHNKKGNK